MKSSILFFSLCASFCFAQKMPLSQFEKQKTDSTKSLKFDLKDFKKPNIYGKSLAQNTDNLPYKMLVKKIENPEIYSILKVVPKENAIPIPNAFQKNNDSLKVEILEPKK